MAISPICILQNSSPPPYCKSCTSILLQSKIVFNHFSIFIVWFLVHLNAIYQFKGQKIFAVVLDLLGHCIQIQCTIVYNCVHRVKNIVTFYFIGNFPADKILANFRLKNWRVSKLPVSFQLREILASFRGQFGKSRLRCQFSERRRVANCADFSPKMSFLGNFNPFGE